jgi:large subunit ribosomal protein L10
MLRKEKEIAVARLKDLLSQSTMAIVTDYRGMLVSQMSQLRRRLKESGSEYHVVKNNLVSLAAESAGKGDLAKFLKGPSAIVFVFGEEVKPLKALSEYINETKPPLVIKGGLLDGRILSPADIMALATLPSKEVLISQLIQKLSQPVYSLIVILTANIRQLIQIIEARRKQLEGGQKDDQRRSD